MIKIKEDEIKHQDSKKFQHPQQEKELAQERNCKREEYSKKTTELEQGTKQQSTIKNNDSHDKTASVKLPLAVGMNRLLNNSVLPTQTEINYLLTPQTEILTDIQGGKKHNIFCLLSNIPNVMRKEYGQLRQFDDDCGAYKKRKNSLSIFQKERDNKLMGKNFQISNKLLYTRTGKPTLYLQ